MDDGVFTDRWDERCRDCGSRFWSSADQVDHECLICPLCGTEMGSARELARHPCPVFDEGHDNPEYGFGSGAFGLGVDSFF